MRPIASTETPLHDNANEYLVWPCVLVAAAASPSTQEPGLIPFSIADSLLEVAVLFQENLIVVVEKLSGQTKVQEEGTRGGVQFEVVAEAVTQVWYGVEWYCAEGELTVQEFIQASQLY